MTITSGSIESIPTMQPDMLYRNKPCFKINKKELRDLAKAKQLPKKVVDYKNLFGGEVYVRYGTHLTFNTNLFT